MTNVDIPQPKPAAEHVSEGEATAFSLEDVHGLREMFRRVGTVALFCTIVLFVGLVIWTVFGVKS